MICLLIKILPLRIFSSITEFFLIIMIFFVANGNGIIGTKAYLEGIITTIPTLGAGKSAFDINFKWDSDMRIPGAFLIKNHLQVEFFLLSLTLEDIPNKERCTLFETHGFTLLQNTKRIEFSLPTR